jgi:hypothetical protein
MITEAYVCARSDHRLEQDAADTQAAGATCDCDEEWNRRLPRDRMAECCWSTSTVRYEAWVTKGHARDELCADVTHNSPLYRTQDSTR